MPSRYQPLGDYLAALPAATISVTLALGTIEAILCAPLPTSAWTMGWWANIAAYAQARAWLAAGWRVTGHDFRSAVPTITFTRADSTGQPTT